MENNTKEKETERRGTSPLTRLLAPREIKFRAWFPKGHWVAEKYDQMIGDYCGKTIFELFGFFDDEISYMQFTGLKDDNGIEVYEGDIINICEQWEFGETEAMKNHLVVWGGTDYPAFTLKPGLGTEMNELSYLKLAADYNEKFVVIGNVFETPELLE